MPGNKVKFCLSLTAVMLAGQCLLAPLAQAAPADYLDQCPEPPCVFEPGPGPAGPTKWQPSPGGANQRENFPGKRPGAPDLFNNRTPDSQAGWFKLLARTGLIFFPAMNALLVSNFEPISYADTAGALAYGLTYYLSRGNVF